MSSKLEIALEKSRREREEALVSMPARDNYSASTSLHSVPSVTDYSSETLNERQLERNRIVAYRNRSAEADVYRLLRTQVLQIMNKGKYKTLAITSPNYGDGKTTVALNLGVSIALDHKQTVLLVDLDLRKPNMHQYLGVKPQLGLTDYLLENRPLHECMMRPPFERLNTLPAGSALDNSSEILGSPKMAALARELKGRYADRMVIYDMPPVLAQDDSLAFLPQVDAVLVVVRDGVTKAKDLKRSLNMLSRANVVGTLLNDYW